MTERTEYSPGETVHVKARLLRPDGTPLENATMSAELFDEEGRLLKSVRFVYLQDSGGEYRAQVRNLPRGRYRIVPVVPELGGLDIAADCSFDVRDLATSEYVQLPRDDTALRRLCDTYRDVTGAADVADGVPIIALTEEHRQDVEIWDSFWLLAPFALLLGLEWHLRKRLNLA
jgi:hypothetical protein